MRSLLNMKIKYSELDRAFQILMDALKEGIIYPSNQIGSVPDDDFAHLLDKKLDKEICFRNDYYWTVLIGERHNLYNEPKLGMGSIDHDLEIIHKLISGDYPLSEHFRFLGDILIALADEFGNCNEQGDGVES